MSTRRIRMETHPGRPALMVRRLQEARAREARAREAQARKAQARKAQVREAQVRKAQAREAQVREAQVREAQAPVQAQAVQELVRVVILREREDLRQPVTTPRAVATRALRPSWNRQGAQGLESRTSR